MTEYENTEYYGYKVGDKFTVNLDYPYSTKLLQGDVVTLCEDDGTFSPLFDTRLGGRYLSLYHLTPLKEEKPKMKNYREMSPEDEVDLKIDGVSIPCDLETLLFICYTLGLRTHASSKQGETWKNLNTLLMNHVKQRLYEVTTTSPFEETDNLTLRKGANDGFFLNIVKNKRKKEIEDQINLLKNELASLEG